MIIEIAAPVALTLLVACIYYARRKKQNKYGRRNRSVEETNSGRHKIAPLDSRIGSLKAKLDAPPKNPEVFLHSGRKTHTHTNGFIFGLDPANPFKKMESESAGSMRKLPKF